QVEAELRELHGDLAVESFGVDPFDEPEVVRSDLVGLLEPGDVLAQTREDDRDPILLEVLAGAEGGHGILTGHEPEDRAPSESKPGQVVAKPPVRRHPQEDPAQRPGHVVATVDGHSARNRTRGSSVAFRGTVMRWPNERRRSASVSGGKSHRSSTRRSGVFGSRTRKPRMAATSTGSSPR